MCVIVATVVSSNMTFRPAGYSFIPWVDFIHGAYIIDTITQLRYSKGLLPYSLPLYNGSFHAKCHRLRKAFPHGILSIHAVKLFFHFQIVYLFLRHSHGDKGHFIYFLSKGVGGVATSILTKSVSLTT